ncbi:MAG: carbon starvation protein A, partial [Spirochaetales bacterium]|nr:carbon starvation protein A [Spirochaetales bacterium]
MISFFVSIAVLIIAYHTFGRVVSGVFEPDDRATPAISNPDGVDFVPMKAWKAFLVELLNIAGTGPIFGALMGACFGPVVFIWIVIGGILAGAVHDYMIGMISMRNNGESIAELSGRYLGKPLMWVMRVFSVLLLILTGTVFVNSPAALIADLTPWANDTMVWVVVILAYYILATLLPIDKVIGKFYPIFGAVMLIMAFCITGAIIFGDYHLPELTLENLHPEGLPIWPYMFVTVACGAISGFHATQAPMISKCLMKESDGRHVFYGAML